MEDIDFKIPMTRDKLIELGGSLFCISDLTHYAHNHFLWQILLKLAENV
jgi:hypothetical protein